MWNKAPEGLARTRQLIIILQGESRSVTEHCSEVSKGHFSRYPYQFAAQQVSLGWL